MTKKTEMFINMRKSSLFTSVKKMTWFLIASLTQEKKG